MYTSTLYRDIRCRAWPGILSFVPLQSVTKRMFVIAPQNFIFLAVDSIMYIYELWLNREALVDGKRGHVLQNFLVIKILIYMNQDRWKKVTARKKKDLWLIRLKLFYISFSFFFKYSFWKVVTDSALLSPAENVALVQCVERETLTLAKSNGFRCIFTSNSSPLTQVQARTRTKKKLFADRNF